MAVGNRGSGKFSPIVEAIQTAEKNQAKIIRVHLSQRWWEPDPWKRASELYEEYDLSDALFVYINLRRKKFAIIGDSEWNSQLDSSFWKVLSSLLRDALQSTHYEKAIAEVILDFSEELAKAFKSRQKVKKHR